MTATFLLCFAVLSRLRVDPQSGAGMVPAPKLSHHVKHLVALHCALVFLGHQELSHCSAGYLIETLESWPGQPSLRQRDVIVAAGEALFLEFLGRDSDAAKTSNCWSGHSSRSRRS